MAELHAKVRSAAIAGWWTLLFAAGFALLLWISYTVLIKPHPPWVLSVMGPDLKWSTIQTLYLWIFSVYRLIVWILLLVVLWLTLWARQLRRHTPAGVSAAGPS